MAELFQVVTPAEALQRLFSHLGDPLPPEDVPVQGSLGRVLAADVSSPIELPTFPRSNMDGYAVRAQDTFGASDGLPAYLKVSGEVPMGRAPAIRVRPGEAVRVATGAMIPDGADAVVIVEQTQEVDPTTIEVYRPVASGGNVVQIGESDLYLASTNAGSLAGLLALKRGEAHMAGSHLLDEETGEYNLPHVRRLLPDEKVVVLTLVHREQGPILPTGNPKGITSLADLTRQDVVFVNRQKGAGTRMLLDYKVKKLGVDPADIAGYDREEYTHLAVAAAVKAGVADVGLGILGAARALGLDFVPLLKERYDLIIPEVHYGSRLLGPLLDLVRSEAFKTEVAGLGGYDTSETGRLVHSRGDPSR